VIYLLLFGELFRSVADIPASGSASYIAFLTPGIVIQTALFSAGWSGGSVIEDLDRGVMDRFLVSPASRGRADRGAADPALRVVAVSSR
jgi:ABC-2 type transport system permease protein